MINNYDSETMQSSGARGPSTCETYKYISLFICFCHFQPIKQTVKMTLLTGRYGEHVHKKHGIDIDALMLKDVINNEKCFWNIAQCQTDRLNYFYNHEEKRIAKIIFLSHKTIISQDLDSSDRSLTPSDRDGSSRRLSALADLENLVLQIQDLMGFLESSRVKFYEIVEKFDERHNSNTASAEIETFESTYQFMDNDRLQRLKVHVEKLVDSSTAKILDQAQVSQHFRSSFVRYVGKDLL